MPSQIFFASGRRNSKSGSPSIFFELDQRLQDHAYSDELLHVRVDKTQHPEICFSDSTPCPEMSLFSPLVLTERSGRLAQPPTKSFESLLFLGG